MSVAPPRLFTMPPGAPFLPTLAEALLGGRLVPGFHGDDPLALANATIYLETAGHIAIAWIWLEQALAAEDRSGDFYEGKRSAARFFFLWELPRVDAQLDLLASLDRTTLDMRDECF